MTGLKNSQSPQQRKAGPELLSREAGVKGSGFLPGQKAGTQFATALSSFYHRVNLCRGSCNCIRS